MADNNQPKTILGWNAPLTVSCVIVLSIWHILPIAWEMMQALGFVALTAAILYFVETKSWELLKQFGAKSDIGAKIVGHIEYAVGLAAETRVKVQERVSGWQVPSYLLFWQKSKESTN